MKGYFLWSYSEYPRLLFILNTINININIDVFQKVTVIMKNASKTVKSNEYSDLFSFIENRKFRLVKFKIWDI